MSTRARRCRTRSDSNGTPARSSDETNSTPANGSSRTGGSPSPRNLDSGSNLIPTSSPSTSRQAKKFPSGEHGHERPVQEDPIADSSVVSSCEPESRNYYVLSRSSGVYGFRQRTINSRGCPANVALQRRFSRGYGIYTPPGGPPSASHPRPSWSRHGVGPPVAAERIGLNVTVVHRHR